MLTMTISNWAAESITTSGKTSPIPPIALPNKAVSTVEKVLCVLKIIAAIALFVSGIVGLVCWSFGAAPTLSAAIIMLLIMIVSFALVIWGIRDGFERRTTQEIRKQLEFFRGENERFGVENSRLHEEIEVLLEANAELREQVGHLRNLQSKLQEFGLRMEKHTGDFAVLAADFRNSLSGFEDAGEKVSSLVTPFQTMLTSLEALLSTESVQALTSSVSSLRLQIEELEAVVSMAQTTLQGIKEEALQKELQVKFLEERQKELEAACRKIQDTIAVLESTAGKISIAVGTQTGTSERDEGETTVEGAAESTPVEAPESKEEAKDTAEVAAEGSGSTEESKGKEDDKSGDKKE
ncbi:incA family protein [Chlamydia psittaci 10_743_SC13]|nr:incA family protein [Chlamydia psittaci 10_743_SC13]